ncbi:hypothetical protein [Micromonospora sp. NPDC023888]|uniref:hypothetical protein n=1 Tax=Micromonospora sp. NPDC023888 TaxID=3155607 RepID=UPI0033D985BD
MAMVATSCSIGRHASDMGGGACAIFGRVSMELEDGSLTVAQAEPELRRALKLAGEAAAAGGEESWHDLWQDLAVTLQQLVEAQDDLAAFDAAGDRATEICAPVTGT